MFNAPMRVETVQLDGAHPLVLGLVGVQSERCPKVTVHSRELESLAVHQTAKSFDGDGKARSERLGGRMR
jgi:hypothetical protein